MLHDLRDKVCWAACEMFKAGLVRAGEGNVSAKDPETGYIAITPSGMPYKCATADDIIIVDTDKKTIWGKRKPSSETPMHTHIHKHRPDVFAVTHSHSWYATLFAIANRDLPPATMGLAANFGAVIRCAPYCRPGSDEMGPTNLKYLDKGSGVLLGNHGVLCIGPNLEKALKLSNALEEGAKLVYHANLIGPAVPLPDKEVDWFQQLFASFETKVA